MSKGSYTILDSYNGNVDIMLSGTKKLNERLDAILQKNKKMGLPDPRPVYKDVFQTHNFFTTTAFRPHVAIGYEYYKKSKQGGDSINLTPNQNPGPKVRFNLQGNEGDWIHDMVVHVVFQSIGQELNPPINAIKYSYADLPGIRLCKRVELNVQETVVDSYTADDVLMMDFHISPDNRASFVKSMGQEEIKKGSYYFKDQRVTQHMEFSNGAQTLKPFQQKLELWIPLLFWFNLDVRQSLHNLRVKTQERNIDITMTDLNDIVQVTDQNNNVIPNYLKNFNIEKIDLYTKNIYVNSEIHDLFTERKHLALIRVRKSYSKILKNKKDQILMNSLKYPIEFLEFGFRPIANEQGFNTWHRFHNVKAEEVPIPALIYNPMTTPVQQLVVRTATFLTREQVVKYVGFKAHGNTIYPMMPPEFYNQHVPLANPGIISPEDCGKMIAAFNLLPGSNELSGHFNNSVAREFYMLYEAKEDSTLFDNSGVRLYVLAKCINFLIYDNSSLQLKYIT